MERNLNGFRHGEPKMVNFEGHDPRLISNPSLCEIYSVLLLERERLLSCGCVDDADDIDDTINELVITLRERVYDCYDAEFGKRHISVIRNGQKESE